MKTPRQVSAKHAALEANWRALRGWASGPWKNIARTVPGATGVVSEAQAQRAAINAWEDEGGATVAPSATKFGTRLFATRRRSPQP